MTNPPHRMCVSMMLDHSVRLCQQSGPELSETPAVNWSRLLDAVQISFPFLSGESHTFDCKRTKNEGTE